MTKKQKLDPTPEEDIEEDSWEIAEESSLVPEAPEAPVASSSESNWDNSTEVEDWGEIKTVTVELEIAKHTGKFAADFVKYLFYGESGTGKTRLASTFPNVIFADIDHGMSSVTEQVARIDIEDDPAQQISAFEKLEHMYKFLKTGNHNYKTVVIDTLNEMQRIAMQATVEDFPAIRRSYENLPSQSDYGKMLHDFIELVRNFIALPMQVVLLAQVGTRQFETDVLQPQLIGKNTSREICRKMDVIGYIQTSPTENTDTHMRYAEIFFNSSEAVVKDRSFLLPALLVDPNYDRIRSYLDKSNQKKESIK